MEAIVISGKLAVQARVGAQNPIAIAACVSLDLRVLSHAFTGSSTLGMVVPAGATFISARSRMPTRRPARPSTR